MTYGFAPGREVRADAVESAGAEGMRFDLVADGARQPVTIPTLGRLERPQRAGRGGGRAGVRLPVGSDPTALAFGWSAPHAGRSSVGVT